VASQFIVCLFVFVMQRHSTCDLGKVTPVSLCKEAFLVVRKNLHESDVCGRVGMCGNTE
jgi:hypothetical protein